MGTQALPAGEAHGILEGAPFTLALPTKPWNHRLLLLAAGYRPESEPLIAYVPATSPLCVRLLDQGWIIGATGYPSNGVALAAAAGALDTLRAHVIDAYGPLDETLILGEGTGATVATLLAERLPGAYQGAVAIDPLLSAREANTDLGLSLDPKIPLVILATRKGALAQARAYVTAKMPRPEGDPLPRLFLIDRDGVGNVNDAERSAAVDLLERWVDRGPGALPSPEEGKAYVELTVPPPPRPARVRALDHAPGFTSVVIAANPVQGSAELDARPEDLESLGIGAMSFFRLEAAHAPLRVQRGKRGQRAKPGSWIAFDDADGYVSVYCQGQDSAETAGLAPGDVVTVTATPPQEP